MNPIIKRTIFIFMACGLLDLIGLIVHKDYGLISYIAFSGALLLIYNYTRRLKGKEEL